VDASQRQRIVLVLALILAIAGTFVFGYRVGGHARHIRRQNEPVRAWMSVPFIAHTHHVDPEILFEAAGVPPQPQDRRSLRKIARAEKRPVDDVIHAVENAIANARKAPNGKGP
jgi:uncharacterized membrane protein